MTQFEIVAAVMNLVTSAEGVTNTSLSEDQVAAEINTCRQRMIDDQDKVALFRRPFLGYVQTIKSIDVQKDETTGELYIQLPRVYKMLSNEPAILYIGGKDDGSGRRSPYRVLSITSEENATHDQFIGKMPMAIYDDNGRVKFRNVAPKAIEVVGVFEYPDELSPYGYDDEESDYPFPGGLIDKLIGKTAESYLRTMYRITPQPNTQSDIANARPNSK